ncbi:transforming growth factor-beta-induced protein ig-h3-like [Apostichopus japonicus]|uniref:transforming growth factor-beta-induced protein ig-h3-like n=1 Tax=Stichopus japonicus TaxID=307972 RepID=UPI003AB7A768
MKIAFLLLVVPFLSAYSFIIGEQDGSVSVPLSAQKTVVDVVVELKLNILVDLVKRAGLVETLMGPGPFTVFGPTDDAFEALPFEVRQKLAQNKTLLTEVLEYHVVGGAVFSKDIAQDKLVPSVLKDNIRFNTYPVAGPVKKVTATGSLIDLSRVDQNASNGVVHVLDKVMFPVPRQNLVETAKRIPELKSLVEALVKTNLTSALAGAGNFTVFAPNNKAFSKVPAKVAADIDLLTSILLYHVSASPTLYSVGLEDSQQIPTLNTKNSLTINLKDGQVQVANSTDFHATVLMADGSVSNGVIHVIDEVLLPPSA